MADTLTTVENYRKGEKFLADKQYARAFTAFREAAEEEHPAALMRLGYMYRYGIGVQQDLDRAVALFEGAVARGDTHAKGYLGNFLMHGTSGRFLGNISHPRQVWRGFRLIASGMVDALRVGRRPEREP